MLQRCCAFTCLFLLSTSAALADRYYLLVGADARHYPGQERFLTGPTGTPGPIYDGDRLAGTSDVGPLVPYVGSPGTQPLYDPNYLGSLSMLYRRGTIPFAGGVPILGIEFLGGPLLDLDGELANGVRRLTPVDPNDPNAPPDDPVEIPDTNSFIELVPDFADLTISLADFDATGTNEGAPNFGPDICTILVTIAGTTAYGEKTGPINPGIDTRLGALTPFAGNSGTLAGVYRITGLGFEVWEDSIDPFTSSPSVLGTMQFLGTWQGWLVRRDPLSGQYPALAGEGLGSTAWPLVDTAHIGQTYNTANGLAGGSATILNGAGGDLYTAPGNGGLPLTDYGGDLGAYLDAQVVPRLAPGDDNFVYLESAGFGINNSFDPVFSDTVGWDVAIIAATSCGGFVAGDVNCDGQVDFADINPFVAALSAGESAWQQFTMSEDCTFVCVNDISRDGVVDFGDINPFVALLTGTP